MFNPFEVAHLIVGLLPPVGAVRLRLDLAIIALAVAGAWVEIRLWRQSR